MTNETVEALIHKIAQLKDGVYGPFPTADCRKLATITGELYMDFKADLNTYNMSVTAPIDWGEKITDWSIETIQRFSKYTEQSFFEKFPEYVPLVPYITKDRTPNLYTNILLHDEVRVSVHSLMLKLEALIDTKNNTNS
jgi:hypothetical protein